MNYRESMSRLNSALSNIDSTYAIIAKKHGLTFNALMMVYLLEESDTITQKNCEELHLPKSTVHSIMLDFIKQEYVILEAGNNKKEKHIVVTGAGKAYFSGIYEGTDRMEKNVLHALGDEACDFLVRTAETLGSLMKKELGEIYHDEVR